MLPFEQLEGFKPPTASFLKSYSKQCVTAHEPSQGARTESGSTAEESDSLKDWTTSCSEEERASSAPLFFARFPPCFRVSGFGFREFGRMI